MVHKQFENDGGGQEKVALACDAVLISALGEGYAKGRYAIIQSRTPPINCRQIAMLVGIYEGNMATPRPMTPADETM